MRPPPIVIIAAAFCAGVAVGWLGFGRAPSTGGGGDTDTVGTGHKLSETPWSSPPRKPGLTPTTGAGTDAANQVADDREGDAEDSMVALPAGALVSLGRAWATPAAGEAFFHAEDPLLSILDIKDGERAQIQQSWHRMQITVRRVEAASAEFLDHEDGSVSIRLSPPTAASTAAHARFARDVSGVLGKDRAAALLALKRTEDALDQDDSPRNLHITVENAGAERWRYRVEEERSGEKKIWIADAIPENLRHLTDAAGIKERVNDPSTEEDGE